MQTSSLSAVIAAFVSVLVGLFVGYNSRNQEVAGWRQVYDDVRPRWFSGTGGDMRPFHVVSLDKGKTWWAVDVQHEDGAVFIRGPAEAVHPGVLKEITQLRLIEAAYK